MKDKTNAWFLRLVPFLLGVMVLLVYLLTMAPVLTWEHAGRDGGDLISAAHFLGVPHPTGYPTFTMLAWPFTRLPLGSVAWRVHFFCGLAGVAAVVWLYLVGRRSACGELAESTCGELAESTCGELAESTCGELAESTAAHGRGPATLGAAVGALSLAFSPLFWGHSLIAEVYTLHLCFIALILWLMLRWRDGKGPLPLAALVFGVGLGNHITLTFLALAILPLLWSGRERLSWRVVFRSALALGAGALVYLYLPWRAATDPVINWGDPDNLEGFWWAVSGQGYQRFFFALPWDEVWPRLQEWLFLSNDQFIPLAWPLVLWGLYALGRHDRWLALGTVLHAAMNLIYSIGYNVTDAFVHLLPVYLYLALWMGQGAAALWTATRQLRGTIWQGRGFGELTTGRELVNGLVVAGLLASPLLSLAQEWSRMDLTDDRRAHNYAREALEAVEPGALIVVGSDAYTFALWYYRYVEELRTDVAVVNYPMLSFDWYVDTVSIYHPQVVMPGPSTSKTRKRNTVLNNMDQRAVYITQDEGDMDGLELTPVGPLWRVTQ